jgi:hypothetical protein
LALRKAWRRQRACCAVLAAELRSGIAQRDCASELRIGFGYRA